MLNATIYTVRVRDNREFFLIFNSKLVNTLKTPWDSKEYENYGKDSTKEKKDKIEYKAKHKIKIKKSKKINNGYQLWRHYYGNMKPKSISK